MGGRKTNPEMDVLLVTLTYAILLSSCWFTCSAEGQQQQQQQDDHPTDFGKYYDVLPTQSLRDIYRQSQMFILAFTPEGIVATLAKEFGVDLTNASSLDKFQASKQFNAESELPKILKAGVGYVVLVAIGVVLAFFFLFSCLCLFCCRKCGCCCGSVADRPAKGSQTCPVAVLLVVVVVASVLLALTAYGATVSGLAASSGLERNPKTSMPRLVEPIRNVFRFIPKALQDINDTLNVNELMEDFKNIFPNVSEIIKKQLANLNDSCTSCVQLVDSYNVLGKEVELVSANTMDMNRTMERLQTEYNKLNASLAKFKDDLTNSTEDCRSTQSCRILRGAAEQLRELRTIVDFELPAVDANYLEEFKKYSLDFFKSSDFANETEQIYALTKSFLEGIKNQMNQLPLDTINNYEKYFDRNSKDVPWHLVDDINKHTYLVVKIVAIVVATWVAVIIFLNILAVIVGSTCRESSPRASQGVFLASTQISFCLAPIFCIVAILLLIFGSLFYRELCFDLKKGPSSTYLQLADSFVQKEMKGSGASDITFDGISVKVTTDSINFVTGSIYGDCKRNESIAKILTENVVVTNETVREILNKVMPDMKNFVDKFKVEKLPIFSDESIKKLNESSAAVKKFNYTFNSSAPLIVPPLSSMRILMESAKQDIVGENKNRMQQLLDKDLKKLENQSKEIINEELYLSSKLNETTGVMQNISILLDKTIVQIQAAKIQIQGVNMSADLLESIEVTVETTFWKFYKSLIIKLEKSAHCRELYDSVESVIFGLCDLIVYPLNGFWLCLGILVVLLIPSFLAGLWLGGIYARKGK